MYDKSFEEGINRLKKEKFFEVIMDKFPCIIQIKEYIEPATGWYSLLLQMQQPLNVLRYTMSFELLYSIPVHQIIDEALDRIEYIIQDSIFESYNKKPVKPLKSLANNYLTQAQFPTPYDVVPDEMFKEFPYQKNPIASAIMVDMAQQVTQKKTWEKLFTPGEPHLKIGILSELVAAVPGLKTKVNCPVSLPDGSGLCNHFGEQLVQLSNVVMHLNDNHKWTREAIADWLESLDVDLELKGLVK